MLVYIYDIKLGNTSIGISAWDLNWNGVSRSKVLLSRDPTRSASICWTCTYSYSFLYRSSSTLVPPCWSLALKSWPLFKTKLPPCAPRPLSSVFAMSLATKPSSITCAILWLPLKSINSPLSASSSRPLVTCPSCLKTTCGKALVSRALIAWAFKLWVRSY